MIRSKEEHTVILSEVKNLARRFLKRQILHFAQNDMNNPG
jgi:hypothetical protein